VSAAGLFVIRTACHLERLSQVRSLCHPVRPAYECVSISVASVMSITGATYVLRYISSPVQPSLPCSADESPVCSSTSVGPGMAWQYVWTFGTFEELIVYHATFVAHIQMS
jgi:hypothetical protein